MGKIAEQIHAQVTKMEESTIALSRFIGAIVYSLGGQVTVEKDTLKAVMENQNWFLDVSDVNEETVTFSFVEDKGTEKKGLLS